METRTVPVSSVPGESAEQRKLFGFTVSVYILLRRFRHLLLSCFEICGFGFRNQTTKLLLQFVISWK